MCAIDDSDHADFVSEVTRKARKEHTCSECFRTIIPGETYFVAAIGSEGSVRTNKRCSHCNVAAGWLEKHCGGWCYGGIREDLEEHWDNDYRADGLQRILIGIRRQWKTFQGEGLLPCSVTPSPTPPE
jgi:hypothetical protein